MDFLTPLIVFVKPFFSLFGFSTLGLMGLAIAAAWFIPGLRTLAITVAVAAGCLFGAFHYGHGRGDREGSARVNHQWDQANEAAARDKELLEKKVRDQAEADKRDALAKIRADLDLARKKAKEFQRERDRLKEGRCIATDDVLRRLPTPKY
jgi:hypothetical protein